jgi:hypothetical protein
MGRLLGRIRNAVVRWWRNQFTGFGRREAWGYGVWMLFSVVVLVPEFWAAFWKDSAPFPTISGTTGALEYDRPWLALVVTGVIVLCVYSSFRFPKTRTGVLQKWESTGEASGESLRGDQALPYRTPGGGRFTRSTTPVRELSTVVYFAFATVFIIVCTTIAATASDPNDEYYVGRTLYGLIALFWIAIPSFLAWPKRWALDVPFPTLFSTVRSLERRLRVVALLVVAGMTILLLHLVLYPWPSIIPDLSRTHRTYECHPLDPAKHPLTPEQKADCERLDEANGKPEPVAP